MAWYTAHYRSWANWGSVTRIDFGKYCYGTFSRKEAFQKAQETANQTGETVIVMWDIPTGKGLEGHMKEVHPE